jgi:hypothetical protein
VKGDFRARYGRSAVVAGASEGLGAAFAEALAARGLDLVLLARRAAVLEALGAELTAKHGVAVRTLACDLAEPGFADALAEATRGLEVGLGVYNAAYSFVGPLLERPLEDALRVVEVNCAGPLRFVHALAPAMLARGRGGLVLMSSLAAFHGGPRLAAYAASKAFNLILAEGLWGELAPKGVDVLASCPGAIRTPGYLRRAASDAPGTLDPEVVATRTLDALGRGPTVVPGAVNRLATIVLGRLLPRASAVSIMGRSTADLG